MEQETVPGGERFDAAAQERIAAAEALAERRGRALDALRREVVRLAEAAPGAAAPAPAEAPPPAPRPPGWARRGAVLAYRLVRPVVRPLAWRLRSFLVVDVRRELFEVSARLDRLMEQQAARRLEESGDLGRMGRALERLMLTLALEEGRGGAASLPKDDGGG